MQQPLTCVEICAGAGVDRLWAWLWRALSTLPLWNMKLTIAKF